MRIHPCGLVLLLMLFAETVLGQVQGIVVDKATGKPVTYANIWVENENLGTTSSETGAFSFADASAVGKMLVVSCLGYEKGRFPIKSGSMTVELVPAAVALQEVTVKQSAQRQKVVVGKLERTKPAHWYATGGTPWIVADFVPYAAQYEGTPFLDQIAFVLWSKVDKAKFQIRLLEVSENGQPGKDLLPKPLIGVAPKGINMNVALDVSEYNLQVPKDGFFIAFEWFIIPENGYEHTYTMKGSKKKLKRTSYEPSILTHQLLQEERNGWIYMKGNWNNAGVKGHDGEMHMNRAPQFQITLSD
ncbi:carboxypeptidase-like regulatory domain-containing protein [Rufibacter sp. XAAS-G3-1]|uniref:carboxypeptidase-like regulatory domain-containing protein n=1 Tax=Rufibacter sp. XAAS-G3-1 TaxID=2729134 RepID=UPI0015E7B9BB|nr:carboxypeptidase-like regulatory domain-containing protein [Rufibacter sp. XAAS-G3-1]